MKRRLITGIIVVFLVLAIQDVFFGRNAMDFEVASKHNTTETSLTSENLLKSDFNRVAHVVDGDTIVVLVNGVSEKVRLIGVDTPETVDPRKPVQCFGKEASDFMKALLSNTEVHLEADASQGDRDKYGRLLRYVFLADGTLVNEKIIAEGYGYEYTYRIPYQYKTEFKNAERLARESQKGLWANGACDLENIK